MVTSTTLLEYQEKANSIASALSLPSFKYGQGMTLRFDHLDVESAFEQLRTSAQQQTLTINTPSSVIVKPLSSFPVSFIQQYGYTLLPPSEHKLLASHHASHHQPMVIHIPACVKLLEPIRIQSHVTQRTTAESIIIIADEESDALIIEESSSTEACALKTQTIQIYLKPHATVNYCSVQLFHHATHNWSWKRSQHQKDAVMRWIDSSKSTIFSQMQICSLLEHEGSSSEQYTFFANASETVSDYAIEAVHTAHSTSSKLLARGIIDNHGKGIYRGTVTIKNNAPHSRGLQRVDSLLLGPKARCDAVPVLDVEHDDVICSHSAALHQIQNEELYYLCSRGVPEEEARQMIMEGFFQSLWDIIPSSVREMIPSSVSEVITTWQRK